MGSASSKHKKHGQHGEHYHQTVASAGKSPSVFPLNPVPHVHTTTPNLMSRDKSVFVHTPNAYNRALHPPVSMHGARSTPVYPEQMMAQSNAGSASGKQERRGIMKQYPAANYNSNPAPPVIPYSSGQSTTPSVTPAAFPPPPIIGDQNIYTPKQSRRAATPFTRTIPPPESSDSDSDSDSSSPSSSSSDSTDEYEPRPQSRNGAVTPRFAVPPSLQQPMPSHPHLHPGYAATPYPPQPASMSMPSPVVQPPPMPIPSVPPPPNPPEPPVRQPNLNGPIPPMTPAQPSAYGPQRDGHRAPLKNRLPTPPRDLYELAPFDSLREMSETTKFILLGQEHAMKTGANLAETNTIVPGLLDYIYNTSNQKKDEKKKGLFRALSTRGKKDAAPKMVPVFVNTNRAPSVDNSHAPQQQQQHQQQQHQQPPPPRPPSAAHRPSSSSVASSLHNPPQPQMAVPHLSHSPIPYPAGPPVLPNGAPVRPPSRTASTQSKTTHRSGFSVEVPNKGRHHRDSGSSSGTTSSMTQPTMAMPEPQTAAANTGRPAPLPIPFSHTTPYASFLNHSKHRVMFQNKTYPTATHLFEALKFLPEHPEIAERIVNCQDPVQAVYISVQAEYKKLARPDWKRIYLKVMEDVLWRKFQQHPKLRAMLLNTGEAELIYADEGDAFWGRGPTGDGKNELGKALMRTRVNLKLQSANPESR